MTPAQAVQAQRSAEIALELVRAGMAPPNLLADLVEQMPGREVREFLRAVQKAIEQGAQLSTTSNKSLGIAPVV